MSKAGTTYPVGGMTCGGCERSVIRAVSRATPGVTVTASHEANTITIVGAHDPAAVSAAVEGAGFSFGG